MITLNSRIHRDRFGSQHYISSALSKDRQLIILSGIVLVHFSGPDEHAGEATQWNWHREQLYLTVDLDALLPPDKWFHIEQWAPMITVNAFVLQVPPDAGFAGGGFYHYPGVVVDSFWLEFPDPATDVRLRGDIAVRYPASQLFRIAYHVTLTGTFVDPPPPPG
jgi:hypothetical protein